MKKIKDKFKKIYRKYGWKAVVALFVYYLVRDVSLYILLPWAIAKGIF
tara:strand:+ start:135 stop:278 length:144 start_codon:yes stop_codon:yes gene_type:complete